MQPKNKDVTILVIDDDRVDVMAVKRALRHSGLEGRMLVAHDGMEALTMLRDGSTVQHPYLVLLDLNMPRMNGIEFLKEARHDPALKSAVIFVLTTSRAEEDMKKAYEHNIAGYIVKEGSADGYINAANLLERYSSVVALP